MKRAFVALGAVLFLFAPSLVNAKTAIPARQGFVNDFANVLSVEDEQSLTNKLQAYQNTSTNSIVVVTIANLNGDDVADYAIRLTESWGIGNKDKDNGILLLNAIEDRQVTIQVGYGLEGDLTDGQAGTIRRDYLNPDLKQGNYFQAYNKATDAIIKQLSGEIALPEASQSETDNKNWGTAGFIVMVILFQLLAAVGHWLAKSKAIWQGGLIGVIGGIVVGFIIPSILAALFMSVILGMVGIFLDWILSRSYKPGSHRNNIWFGGGGWGGGGSASGGSSPFGGGSFGGGGSSGGY